MNREDIAIIGISFRFPQAETLEEFWHLLTNKIDVIAQFNRDENNSSSRMLGGFLSDIDKFDADFFNISPEEACLMSPQQRLLLESAWLALEDARIIPQHIAGSDTSIFITTGENDYFSLIDNKAKSSFFAITGNNRAITVNRISSYFDFQGASVFIDTACSSSLVAINNACQTLWMGESSLALVGGANLIFSDENFTTFTDAEMISPDGCCKVFDASANGYVQGEGVAMIVLKPLSQALQDGDRIYGTIIDTRVNHNGKSNTLTSPNLKAQTALLEKVYNDNAINPHTIKYIEAHAVGTIIGDALELKAIGKILGKNRPKNNPLRVGSVKTNIGHTETVSGMAGLIKILLCLQHRQLVPNLHFQEPNPSVTFDKFNLKIQDKLEDLKEDKFPLRMAVSAFGIGGSNGHLVIEEATKSVVKSSEFDVNIFTLSAKSEFSLLTVAQKYIDFINNNPDISLTNLCYSVNVKRTQFNYRFFTVIESLSQFKINLQNFIDNPKFDENNSNIVKKSNKKIDALSFISEKESFQQLDNKILSKKLINLGELWLKGGEINWENFYTQVNAQYIFIPNYAFEKKKYWFTDIIKKEDSNHNQTEDNLTNNKNLVKITKKQNYNIEEVEDKLKKLWLYLFNKKNIDKEDNFFQIGGNSLQAINLSVEIKEIFQIDISSTLIFEYPTLQELSKFIVNNQKNINHSSLTYFNLTGQKDTLIIINSFQLAHLLTDNNIINNHPIVNVNIFKLSEEIKKSISHINPENVIKTIAESMIKDICESNLKQPYQLITFCGDSHLTLEIAHQLRNLNHEIESLILIDGTFNYHKPSWQERSQTFRKLGLNYLYFKGKNYLNLWLNKIKNNRHIVTKPHYLDKIFYESYLLGRSKYNLYPYSGNINLLLSTEWQYADLSVIKKNISHNFKIYPILGLHHHLFDKPYIDNLIKIIIKIANHSLIR